MSGSPRVRFRRTHDMRAQTTGRTRRVVTRARPPVTTTTPPTTVAEAVAGDYTPPPKHIGTCPRCEGPGCLTVEPRPSERGWWVNCWKAECPTGGAYLRELAALTGAPSGGDILNNPLHWLAPYLDGPIAAGKEPDELPSTAALAGWQSRLFSDVALDYLKDERKLTADTIREFGIGWDSDRHCYTFPVRDEQGGIVQLVRRRWPEPWVIRGKRVPYKVLKGHGAQLYPQPLSEGGWLLVAGTLDAVLGRQHGLPTVTSICGTSFPEKWEPLVRGRRVYVMYDVGEEHTMNSRVSHLRAAGAEATPVRLNRLLRRGQGKDLSDALIGGRTKQDIIDLIKRERGARS